MDVAETLDETWDAVVRGGRDLEQVRGLVVSGGGRDQVAAGLTALLELDDPRGGLDLLWRSGLLAEVLPEVAALELDDELAARHKDNLAHTFAVTAMVPARLRVRLAALLHDVGKPPTRRLVDGRVTFRDHEAVGARLARRRLVALGFDEQLAGEVATLVKVSGRLADFEGDWSDAAVRRLVREAGALYDDLCDFAARDCTSRHQEKRERAAARVAEFQEIAAQIAASDARAAIRPALDGQAIMELLGLQPGPEVGAAYRYLLGFAQAGEQLDAGEAETRLRDWWGERGGASG